MASHLSPSFWDFVCPLEVVFVDLSPSLLSVSKETFEQNLFQGSRPPTKNGIVRMKSIEFVELKNGLFVSVRSSIL